jgi:hypothetical protein
MEKGYNVLYAGDTALIELSNKEIPKQMLIGYMIEYLIEHNIKMTMSISIPRIKGEAESKIKPSVRFEWEVEKIKDVYNYLKKEIEELE